MTALACVRCVGVSLKVASQLLHATSGPVKSMEGGLHQRRHDAAHVHLVSTAVALAIVLHPESAHNQTEWVSRRGVRDRAGSVRTDWERVGGERAHGTKKEGGCGSFLIRFCLR